MFDTCLRLAFLAELLMGLYFMDQGSPATGVLLFGTGCLFLGYSVGEGYMTEKAILMLEEHNTTLRKKGPRK